MHIARDIPAALPRASGPEMRQRCLGCTACTGACRAFYELAFLPEAVLKREGARVG